MIEAIEKLLALKDDWDGECSPAPSSRSIREAFEIYERATKEGLTPELDADCLGGVDLYFTNKDRFVWIVIMNNGARSVVITQEHGNGTKGVKRKKLTFTDELFPMIKMFLLNQSFDISSFSQQ